MTNEMFYRTTKAKCEAELQHSKEFRLNTLLRICLASATLLIFMILGMPTLPTVLVSVMGILDVALWRLNERVIAKQECIISECEECLA